MVKNVSYDDVASSLAFNNQNAKKPTFLQKRMLTKLTSMNMESILESKESVRSPTVSGTTFQLNLDKLTPG